MPQSVSETDAPARFLRWLWLAVALLVGVRLAFWALTGLTIEDSLISLRYAENLARGLGLVYNPGERVFGASTPLHVLLLAGLTRAGLPALACVKLLAIAADGATAFLWGRRLLRETGRWSGALVFLLLFGLSPLVVPVTVSGMETSFALLLISLALLNATDPDHPLKGGAREALRLGVPLGLLMLIRPDGALVAALVLGVHAWRTRRLPVGAGLVAGLILLPWLLAAWSYYGTFIPNSIPAKTAAYNLHRKSLWPNFWATAGEFFPVSWPWWRAALSAAIMPGVVVGTWHAVRDPRLRPLGLLLPVWWAYLVLPKTLLFTWYFPLLLLPGFVLAGLGYGRMAGARFRGWTPPPNLRAGATAWMAVLLVVNLGISLGSWRRVNHAERTVREAIGVWLRENTPADARIAMEPIGYIGYYSGRRILDEVGLVSPEMVPLNRQGAGWFAEMVRRFSPDYIVERPGYLLRNRTLNNGVPLFRSNAEREAFLDRYEAIAVFGDPKVPNPQDYRFVIYTRRSAESADRWARINDRLDPDEREELRVRSLIGPVDLRPLTVLDAHPAALPEKKAPVTPRARS
jgi:hypothetical protein